MDPIIGIDLGTTNSLVAHLAEDGPRIIPNALGKPLTPSVVGIDDDGALIVGAAANELQVLRPERSAALFKRHMGSDWTATLGGRQFSAEELSSLVLRSLKQDAEAYFECPVQRAVVTVPAYFNDRQRKATMHAGKIAQLQVERILNEPTAASLAYGFHESREDKTLLVFDLGGGTFDVSLVEFFDGTLEVRASSGECFLGGEDFTRSFAARLLESRKLVYEHAELEHPYMVARLLRQCELAKCALSSSETALVRIPDHEGLFHPDSVQAHVERRQFQEWTRHLLARVELPIRRVLGDAKKSWRDLDEVILVGGATRMPAVIDLITKLFGKPPRKRLNPDEVVALGAAVQAGLIGRSQNVADLVVTDVAPFTLGFETAKRFASEYREGYFCPLIFRNTTIPASRVERVVTVAPNQSQVGIKIYQGDARRVEDNLLLGEFMAGPLPLGPPGSESVDVRFTYDLNGVLEVEATVVSTGQKCARVITQHAHGLTSAQISAAVEQLQRLKTHPRDEAVNRFLLRRAERLYEELSYQERSRLSSLLDGFEEALELREAQAIERNREALEQFLDNFDRPGDRP